MLRKMVDQGRGEQTIFCEHLSLSGLNMFIGKCGHAAYSLISIIIITDLAAYAP